MTTVIGKRYTRFQLLLNMAGILLLMVICNNAMAQGEGVAPLGYRPHDTALVKNYYTTTPRAAAKGTAISLPFFEDFTSTNFFPDTNNWQDRQVYINNNMAVAPISRGVATFDALDASGLPYEKSNKNVVRYCDSLTSQPIDLSGYSAGDSLYLSFFYQPQGAGFDPQPSDSLMLFFRRASSTSPWVRVWRVAGSVVEPFKQVMIPITDTNYFNSDFRFRFVNRASINNTDDNWNIDYIRLGAGRNMNDTAVQDVAFTREPTQMLNDYTFMPYQQYIANAAGERATQLETAIRNSNLNGVTVDYGYTSREFFSNTPLSSGTANTGIGNNAESYVTFPTYTNTVSTPAPNSIVTFENKFYLRTTADTGPVENDTIRGYQHFYNYLAYDDGTAEKSYYLNLFSTLPGKIAIEHRLNVPDTLKGIAIYFGRQVPLAYQKYFSVTVYSDIAFGGGNDNVLYQEDFFVPAYLHQNAFWYYKFAQPVILPAGKFYIGTMQPALGSSDSLYFGLDVNRTADNHVYYNVISEWKKSGIQGALMIRPLFGDFFPSVVNGPVSQQRSKWDVMPNPATDKIRLNFNTHQGGRAAYKVTDVQGRTLLTGATQAGEWIDIQALQPGVYFVHLDINDQNPTPTKIIKL